LTGIIQAPEKDGGIKSSCFPGC